MRIAYDLQACQTDSRDRGIGRFADNLVRAMVKASAGHAADDCVIALDGADPQSLRELRHHLRRNCVSAATAVYTYPTSPFIDMEPLRARTAATLRGYFCDSLGVDAYVQLSHFETGAAFTTGIRKLASQPGARVAVAYDLIPLIFPEHYLREGEFIASWYPAKCEELKRFDLLLAISETTRNDLIKYLAIPADRIRVIGAGLDAALLATSQPAGAQSDEALLRALGIDAEFVLTVSNGDWRKNTLGAVEAFARLPAAVRNRHLLVLTQVGREVHAALAGPLRHIAGRIRILGKVDDRTLAALYRSCVVFFFPSFYEGFGLPVLEAMAFGAPVLSSNQGSLPEVAHDARSLFDPHDGDAATALLGRVLQDPTLRDALRQGAMEHARCYTWERCADAALAAIQDLVRRHANDKTRALPMSDAVCVEPSDIALWSEFLAESMSQQDLVALEGSLRIAARGGRRRIIVDITEVIRLDARTGIQRVVRNFCAGLHAHAAQGGYELCPIRWDERDGICHARRYAREQFGLALQGPDSPFEAQWNDLLFMLDSSWWMPERFDELQAAVAKHGGEIVWMVYDLVPILHPQTCNPTVLPAFRHWLTKAVATADGFICISDATRADLERFMDECRNFARRPWTRTVHLGSDLESGQREAAAESVVDLARRLSGSRMFLAVGTVEPRKDYATILAAFEQRWAEAVNDSLVIVGKLGWNMDELARKLRKHREFGARLLWLENVGDGDLHYLMERAAGLIQASVAEGFGLPIAEAGALGVPLLLSDIAVFHEVAGVSAAYFPVSDAAQLARLLAQPELRGTTVPFRTWHAASVQMARVLLGEA